MSLLRTRKAALWVFALVLVLGAFVLLAPEALAVGPEIEDVNVVRYDNDPKNPNINATNYSIRGNLRSDGPSKYSVRIEADAPLVAYLSGSSLTGKNIGVMITLPEQVENYERSTTGAFVPLSASTSLDNGADISVHQETFVWWPNVESLAADGKATIEIQEVGNADPENISSLTVHFDDYETDRDPFKAIYDKINYESGIPTHAEIYTAITGLSGQESRAIANILQRENGRTALIRLVDYYRRAVIAAPGAVVDTIIQIEPGTAYPTSAQATGATLYAQLGEMAEVWFSEPATDATLSGEVDNIEYNRRSAVQVDINVHARWDANTTREITNLTVPIVVTMPIPRGFDYDDLIILRFDNSSDRRPEVVEVLSASRNGGVTFIMEQPGLFVFAEETTPRDYDYDYDYDNNYNIPSNNYPSASLSGRWSGYGDATYNINTPYNRFQSVQHVQGRTTVNPRDYTVSSQGGGTRITFHESFLRTLASGTHTFRVQFSNGYVDLELTVLYAGVPGHTVSNPPKTGDASAGMMGAWMVAAALGMAAIVVWKKRRA